MEQFADATNEIRRGDHLVAGPDPRDATQSRCSPAVPLETAAAYGAPHALGEPAPRTGRSRARARAGRNAAPRGRALPRARRETARERDPPVPELTPRRGRGADVVEPVRPALAPAAHGVEVRGLDLERDRPGADRSVVDLAYGRHLRGRAAHEDLVGEVEVGADEVRLLDRVAEILRDLDHRCRA